MPSFNKVIIAGHLTRDPEARAVGDTTVACFGVAVNEKWRSKNGDPKEKTVFVDVESWGRQGETCAQYLSKGKAVLLEGRLDLDQWEDKNGGGRRSKIFIRADRVQFLGAPGEGGPRSEQPQTPKFAPEAKVALQPPTDDDPPF